MQIADEVVEGSGADSWRKDFVTFVEVWKVSVQRLCDFSGVPVQILCKFQWVPIFPRQQNIVSYGLVSPDWPRRDPMQLPLPHWVPACSQLASTSGSAGFQR